MRETRTKREKFLHQEQEFWNRGKRATPAVSLKPVRGRRGAWTGPPPAPPRRTSRFRSIMEPAAVLTAPYRRFSFNDRETKNSPQPASTRHASLLEKQPGSLTTRYSCWKHHTEGERGRIFEKTLMKSPNQGPIRIVKLSKRFISFPHRSTGFPLERDHDHNPDEKHRFYPPEIARNGHKTRPRTVKTGTKPPHTPTSPTMTLQIGTTNQHLLQHLRIQARRIPQLLSFNASPSLKGIPILGTPSAPPTTEQITSSTKLLNRTTKHVFHPSYSRQNVTESTDEPPLQRSSPM